MTFYFIFFLGAFFFFTQTPALDDGPVTPLLALNVMYEMCDGGVNIDAREENHRRL